MDDNIRKEVAKTNIKKVNSLFEYKPQYVVPVDIAEELSSDPYKNAKERVEKIRKNYEFRGTEHPYPWEDEEYDNMKDILLPSTEPNKNYVKKIYYLDPGISTDPNAQTIQETVESDTKPISPQLNIRGKYGTFISSKKNKNAPFIFILGGLTWPNTSASDQQIGNGPNDSRYPGDKKEGVEGYMWIYGFKNLNDFNIYNSFTHKDGLNALEEAYSILNDNNISVESKILIVFSAGANMIHENGILKNTPLSEWDTIHIIGPTSGAIEKAEYTFAKGANNKTYYIQSKGINVSSEGADSEDKIRFSRSLATTDQTLTSKDHTDGIRVSAEWIKKNIIVPAATQDIDGKKRIIVNSNFFKRVGAKYKGRKTIIISSDSNIRSSPAEYLQFSPIADRAQAANEIAKIKRDPGYKNWAKNIATLCGGDEFLFRLYDLCVDLKCSFRDMMFVIAAECGFRPSATAGSGAEGLIQFVPPKGTRNYSKYGFGSRRPADFSAIQQLPYVKKYYEGRDYYDTYKKKFGTALPNLIATYTFVAGGNTTEPFNSGMKPNKPIYRSDKLRGNRQWDYNGDGVAYAWEIADYAIRHWYFSGKSDEKRGVRLPDGNSWSADGETIGMKIWDLRNNRLR